MQPTCKLHFTKTKGKSNTKQYSRSLANTASIHHESSSCPERNYNKGNVWKWKFEKAKFTCAITIICGYEHLQKTIERRTRTVAIIMFTKNEIAKESLNSNPNNIGCMNHGCERNIFFCHRSVKISST